MNESIRVHADEVEEMRVDTVTVGQVWQDWDKRYRELDPPRLVRVDHVGKTHAQCTVVTTGQRPKVTKIRLDRFRPTSKGYRLHSPAPPPEPIVAVDAPLRQRVAARRLHLAANEVRRLEQVVTRREQRGKSIAAGKARVKLSEARKRLASMQRGPA